MCSHGRIAAHFLLQPDYDASVAVSHMLCGRGGGVNRMLSGFRIISGAPIAGSAVDSVEEIKGYVGLGYPFGILASVLFGRHYKTVLQSPKPKLFVMGTRDGFTSVKQLEGKLKTAAGRAEKRLVAGAGHFEMEGPRYDDEMVGYVVEFADSLDESS